MLRFVSRQITAERLYLGALGLTGLAAVFSVVLPAGERGELAAVVASTTLGSALGGFSLDTFLLSRPNGWVAAQGRRPLLVLILGSMALSVVAGLLLTAIAGIGSYLIVMGGASAMTAFNAFSAFAMRIQRFRFVYSIRAGSGIILIAGYVLLNSAGVKDGGTWGIVWAGSQSIAALTIGFAVLAWSRGFPATQPHPPPQKLRHQFPVIIRLHLGICTHMVTSRIDQILLARFAGTEVLGVYALAVAATEFAQAGSVVRAQKILSDRGTASATVPALQIVKATAPMAILSICALAVLGLLRPDYRQAWILGLCLVIGGLAMAAGKTWSATLLKLRGEQATLTVALWTMVLAVALYAFVIPVYGAIGAALAMSGAYVFYAALTRSSLRRSPLMPAAEVSS